MHTPIFHIERPCLGSASGQVLDAESLTDEEDENVVPRDGKAVVLLQLARAGILPADKYRSVVQASRNPSQTLSPQKFCLPKNRIQNKRKTYKEKTVNL
jgi:hypothetical protein